jgi:hypothetical protein
MANTKSPPLSTMIEKLEFAISQYEQKINDLSGHQESDTDLWSMADIAGYLKFSYKYTNEYIVTHRSFPKPLRFSTNKSKQKSRPR